jgi:ribosomal protein L37AE/L43A
MGKVDKGKAKAKARGGGAVKRASGVMQPDWACPVCRGRSVMYRVLQGTYHCRRCGATWVRTEHGPEMLYYGVKKKGGGR